MFRIIHSTRLAQPPALTRLAQPPALARPTTGTHRIRCILPRIPPSTRRAQLALPSLPSLTFRTTRPTRPAQPPALARPTTRRIRCIQPRTRTPPRCILLRTPPSTRCILPRTSPSTRRAHLSLPPLIFRSTRSQALARPTTRRIHRITHLSQASHRLTRLFLSRLWHRLPRPRRPARFPNRRHRRPGLCPHYGLPGRCLWFCWYY
ncbi:hypothetical protein GGR56DRAFT_624543 [Xylariaceae sp. FL0804]|nr:hypothetical protein GGR56DRAFT_624543 [Xylariaceae sp. FL0804]